MNTWQQDLHRMANDMDHAVTDVEQAGFDPDEYGDLGFPEEHRQEIVAVMDRWNDACGDLSHAANEMIALAERIAPEPPLNYSGLDRSFDDHVGMGQ